MWLKQPESSSEVVNITNVTWWGKACKNSPKVFWLSDVAVTEQNMTILISSKPHFVLAHNKL